MAKPGPKPGSTLTLKPHDTITEGDAVGVLLSNRPERVWLDRNDYERIVAMHRHRAWSWVATGRYVRIRPSKEDSAPLARLVMESDGTGCVRFADGDRLNLRRSNLSIGVRGSGKTARSRAPHVLLSQEARGAPRPFPAAPTAPAPTATPKLGVRAPFRVVQAVKRQRPR